MVRRSVWIGFDPREADAFAVARDSMLRGLTVPLQVSGIFLHELRARGIYTRPTERRTIDGATVLWDMISDAPMSTEFAISRFLTPHLARSGWALFTDCDVLCRSNVARLFDLAESRYAVMCVQHRFAPRNRKKMDGQPQTHYHRKNWSSVMLFNCEHPANARLTPKLVNSLPGRDLHRLCWLNDDEIGALPLSWNWLAGHSSAKVSPDLVHFTDGVPSMPGHERAPYANEWFDTLNRWAA